MAEAISSNTPCFQVLVNEGGDEPKPHWVPYEEPDGADPRGPEAGFVELGGRAFVRTLGDALVAIDRIVRVEHFPLPPWGETPKGE